MASAATTITTVATTSSSAQQQKLSSRYGHQALSSRIVDMVVDTLLNVLPIRARNSNDKTPNLDLFVPTVVQRSQATIVMIMVALIYVERMKERLPKRAVGDYDTPHRLFFVGLMLASKFLNDQSYTNRAWSKVCNYLFRVDELNTMERDFLELIQFDLYLDHETFSEFVASRFRAYDRRLSAELAGLHGPFFMTNTTPALTVSS